MASKSGGLSNCRSRLYDKGSPFIKIRTLDRAPCILPTDPLINSNTSGFFLCGIILEPVQKEKSISMKLNSLVDHKIKSSAILDKCTDNIDKSANISMIKSLSLT